MTQTVPFLGVHELVGAHDVTTAILGPGDWSLLRSLRLLALTDSPHAFLGSLEQESRMNRQDWQARCREGLWVVASWGSRPVGLARLAASPAPGECLHLESMWVAPQVRGRGVGVGLIHGLEHAARARRAPMVGLWVFDHNVAARRLYERLGYRPLNPPRRQFLSVVVKGDHRVEEELRKIL